METDEMELDTIGDRKTALFVIISDTDDTFNFVVSNPLHTAIQPSCATKQMMNTAGGFPSMYGAYLMNLRISGRSQSLKSSSQPYGAGKSPRQSSCRASHS